MHTRAIAFVFCLSFVSATNAQADSPKWQGLFIGVGAGGSWVKQSSETFSSLNGSFLSAGFQEFDYPHINARATYNHLPAKNVVVGTVLTAGYTFTEREAPSGVGVTRYRNEWTGALVGRLGYLVQDNTLLFGVAGVNAIRSRSVRQTPVVTDYIDVQRLAPIVGFGVEAFIAPNWTLLVEARRNFLNSGRVEFPNAGFHSFSESQATVVQFAISYRFGTGESF